MGKSTRQSEMWRGTSSPDKAHTLKQTMEKERQKIHSIDRPEDTTQARWYMIYDSFTLWQVVKDRRKGNGGGVMLVCVSVCGCIVTNWFSCGKNRLPPYHVETRTAFQPAEQPTHSFIWINLTLQGSLPANSALRALSVFLSLRSTLCSWPKLKNVFTLHWLKMNGGVHKLFTLSNLSHSHFFFV